MPKCEVVYVHQSKKIKVGKVFPSYAAVGALCAPGDQVTVRNKAGKMEGWYHQIGSWPEKPDSYYVSRPQMDY